MKTRLSHVTNSSSSSFIISRNDVTKDKLIEILLEIANKERMLDDFYDDEYTYTLEDDVKEEWEEIRRFTYGETPFSYYEYVKKKLKTIVAYRYIIEETDKECPYVPWDRDETYDNHYVVDNDSCCRYNWNIVRDILNKYGIPWVYGDCD